MKIYSSLYAALLPLLLLWGSSSAYHLRRLDGARTVHGTMWARYGRASLDERDHGVNGQFDPTDYVGSSERNPPRELTLPRALTGVLQQVKMLRTFHIPSPSLTQLQQETSPCHRTCQTLLAILRLLLPFRARRKAIARKMGQIIGVKGKAKERERTI
ncbi:hypothetical protein N656DRAFT_95729 [Canariomyces notabilis]|uniref:Uncharacterized protein n=1 Tax=Canariomyces notabilis TaxID=2074819 RepID=A0AAN6YSG5_9PEZI|nr:hypothetical protein N656DRAFT_95729 [Canariomyces arenarius]